MNEFTFLRILLEYIDNLPDSDSVRDDFRHALNFMIYRTIEDIYLDIEDKLKSSSKE